MSHGGTILGLRVHKHLLGAEEKAHIVATMRTSKPMSAHAWAMTFKRLPTTILKIAAEAGIALRP